MSKRNAHLPIHLAGLDEARQLFGMIADAPVEVAVIAYLDDDLRLIGLDRIAGTSSSVDLRKRHVAAGALKYAQRM